MGQHQQDTKIAGMGEAMRRMILLLAVAAVMAMSLVVTASPALAKAEVIKQDINETKITGVITPSEKVNISGHTHPSEEPQDGGTGGGGAERGDVTFGGVDGTVVETLSGNHNGTFHGEL